jgi:hypothetical protein
MSYTNVEILREYIDSPFPVQSRVHDQTVVMRYGDEITFFGGTIDEDSLIVKGIRAGELTRRKMTFDAQSLSLSTEPIVPGSVLLASDSSLGAVYIDGSDYAVDLEAGTVTLKDGGELSVGQSVCAWYQTYHVYQLGVDYTVDGDSGSIRGTASGDIAEGETVYLDYRPVFSSYREEVLDLAVAQANGIIEKAVDPYGKFGADAALQAAATYRALEIVCRASAGRQLSGGRGDSSAVKMWMTLGDYYAGRSDELISSFRPPVSGPSGPTLT